MPFIDQPFFLLMLFSLVFMVVFVLFYQRNKKFKKEKDIIQKNYQKSQKEIEEKLSQMQVLYKIYLKVWALNSKKGFFKQVAEILPLYYPEIMCLEYQKGEKTIPLYENPEYHNSDLVMFKINLGGCYLSMRLKKNFRTEQFFILEPILILSYRTVHHVEKLQNYTLKLKNLDSLRSHFITNISHELRTPLVPLKGYLSILSAHEFIHKQPDLLEMVKNMEYSYKRLENLIENLISFKDEGVDFLNLKTFRVIDLLFNVLMELKGYMDSREIELVLKEKPLNSLELEGDIEKLKLVFVQILNNAIKFNRYGGKVFIKGKETEKHLLIAIKDTGEGIPSHVQDKIFEAFFQGEADVTRRYEGAGLGLAVSKKIVDLHGGKIKVRSSQEGTTVLLIFPKNM